jgi:phage-related tail fiber protein
MSDFTETSSFAATVQKIADQDAITEAALNAAAQTLANRTRYLYDSMMQIGVKTPCQFATTGSITLAGLQTIDGVTAQSGDFVLVKDQANPAENGIYAAASGSWSRRVDNDSSAEMTAAIVSVAAGTANANTVWMQTTNKPTIGTTGIVWIKILPVSFSGLINKPTTATGFGISDMYLYAPPGAVTAFAGSTAPQGWLECNGAIVPNGSGTVQSVTANFSALYAVVADSYGSAGKIPDLRGEFIRGWDHAKGTDPTANRAIGSAQSDEIEAHTHITTASNMAGDLPVDSTDTWGGPSQGAGAVYYKDPPTTSTGGAETRPRNLALMYIIKY